MLRSILTLFMSSTCLLAWDSMMQHGQPGPAERKLLEEAKKLEVRIELEKEVYFAGERQPIHLIVRNRTDQPLRVYDPFDWSNVMIARQFRAPGSTAFSRTSYEAVATGQNWKAPTVIVEPGQVLTQTLANDFDRSRHIPYGLSSGPGWVAGAYCIVWNFGRGARAEYQILPVRLESIDVARFTPDRLERTKAEYGVWLRAFILNQNGKRYLATTMTSNEAMSPKPEVVANPSVEAIPDVVRQLAPYRVIEEVSNVVQVVNIESISHGELVVSLQDGTSSGSRSYRKIPNAHF